MLHCFELVTGKEMYAEKLPDAATWTSPVATWTSPIATADGLVYYVTGGRSYVIKAGPKFEIVSVNDLGDPGHASPAISQGKLFIRGGTKLWCIGK